MGLGRELCRHRLTEAQWVRIGGHYAKFEVDAQLN